MGCGGQKWFVECLSAPCGWQTYDSVETKSCLCNIEALGHFGLGSRSLWPIAELPMQLQKIFYGNRFALEPRNSASRITKPEHWHKER